MKKIRVLIVEDSRVMRDFLRHVIGEDPRLEVAAAVTSGEEALRVLDHVAPDVISMDIRLPGMNGFETTQQIMAERPTPIVVVSASVESEELKVSMKALEAGALAVLEKPAGTRSGGYARFADRLCTQLAIMSEVKVVRRRREIRPGSLPQGHRRASGHRDYRMLGIVSSTGGPNALVQLLNGLGAAFPLPIVLVQHIAASFTEGFALWLDRSCPFSVAIVRGREKAMRGNVYMALRDHHIRIASDYVVADTADPVCGQRPSGTVLFESMANTLGPKSLGALLTGMGDDGAEGLLKIRKSGGYTFAEDESTAVVYGMPAEAVRMGAVCESLPLPAIAPRILEIAAADKEVVV
jgi:two-component system, chemotaxis family, protein-glutamate methylesterase/glutaminase